MKKIIHNLWKDESAQGATEYILILVVLVAAVMLFKGKFMGYIENTLETLGSKITEVTGG